MNSPSSPIQVELALPGGAIEHVVLDGAGPWWIGRDPGCEVVLDSGFVSRHHICLGRAPVGLVVRDTSANGTLVDDVRLVRAERATRSPCELRVGPYRLTISEPIAETSPSSPSSPSSSSSSSSWSREPSRNLRRNVHRQVLEHLDLLALDRAAMDPHLLRPQVQAALSSICAAYAAQLPEGTDLGTLERELCDEVLGLGPLESLLADPEVNEIMVIAPEQVFVERCGRVIRSDRVFTDENAVRAIIERIVTPLGRRIDESTPMVDARLADGSRVNAVIPPLARNGACLTIRKFSARVSKIEALIDQASLDARMARFLERAVRSRMNIVVAGGTGSGKTTLLNVLSAFIGESERVVTIEDAAELRLLQPHVVSLEARAKNLEGRGEVSIRDLLKNALRMRPDRILVGECRGGEAVDMLQAMNTGHDGSMTTTHANTPREALARLETLCLMAGLDLPLRAIRAQIAASLQLLIQLERFGDGTRRIVAISEVVGLSDDGSIDTESIFSFTHELGFHATGYVPRCMTRFIERGLILDGEYL